MRNGRRSPDRWAESDPPPHLGSFRVNQQVNYKPYFGHVAWRICRDPMKEKRILTASDTTSSCSTSWLPCRFGGRVSIFTPCSNIASCMHATLMSSAHIGPKFKILLKFIQNWLCLYVCLFVRSREQKSTSWLLLIVRLGVNFYTLQQYCELHVCNSDVVRPHWSKNLKWFWNP